MSTSPARKDSEVQQYIFLTLVVVVVTAVALTWVASSFLFEYSACHVENTFPPCSDARVEQFRLAHAVSGIGAICFLAAIFCVHTKRRARPWAFGIGACLLLWLALVFL